MSRQTTNYGLTKPDYTDIADIEVVNANMDIIDGALKVIDTKSNNVMSKNSSAWSSTVTYAVGQYCIYNDSLWKCLVQHSGQTPQEGTYWTRVSLDTLGSEISAINQNLSTILSSNVVFHPQINNGESDEVCGLTLNKGTYIVTGCMRLDKWNVSEGHIWINYPGANVYKGLSAYTGYDSITGLVKVTQDNSLVAMSVYNGTGALMNIDNAWFNAIKLA